MAEAPAAASPPTTSSRARLLPPGQPPAARNAPATEAESSSITTRTLNRAMSVLRNDVFTRDSAKVSRSSAAGTAADPSKFTVSPMIVPQDYRQVASLSTPASRHKLGIDGACILLKSRRQPPLIGCLPFFLQ